MIRPILCIEDIYDGFNQPRHVSKIEAGMRDFKILCENTPTAEDLRLWHIGNFNTETGEIEAIKPELVMKGEKNGNQNTLAKSKN